MHEGLPLPVFKCGSEKMVWREKERSTISNVQVDNLRDFLGIPNARFREMYEVKKRVDVKRMKVFPGSLAILKERRLVGPLREYPRASVHEAI